METTDPSDPLYFAALELEGVRCFRERIRLDFTGDDGKPSMWNVILGENGTGKTTILRAACAMERIPKPWLNADSREHTERGVAWTAQRRSIAFGPIDTNNAPILAAAYATPRGVHGRATVTFSVTAFQDGALASSSSMSFAGHPSAPVVAYGARRASSDQQPDADDSTDPIETLFDERALLTDAEAWLLRMKLHALLDDDPRSAATVRLRDVSDALCALLPGVRRMEIPRPPPQRRPGDLKDLVLFHTDDGPVPFSGLSLGYRTIAALAVDLASRLFDAYPDSDDPLREPCIVLIDEIDLHLHPRWQRTVVSYFRERFPRAQFIVTTHSPLVVQASGEDANLILLRRNERGAVEVVNDPHLVSAWRVDQLLTSELFGLSSARPPHVEEELDERARLVALDDRTSEEEARLQALHERASALPTGEDPTAPDDGLELLFELAEQILQNREAARNAPLASESTPEPYATEDQG